MAIKNAGSALRICSDLQGHRCFYAMNEAEGFFEMATRFYLERVSQNDGYPRSHL